MLEIDGFSLCLPREEDVRLLIELTGGQLDENNDTALFTVKRTPGAKEKLIEKELLIRSDGQGRYYTELVLTHTQTDLPPRCYVWDLRILRNAGDNAFTVETPMEYATFEIREVVGDV